MDVAILRNAENVANSNYSIQTWDYFVCGSKCLDSNLVLDRLNKYFTPTLAARLQQLGQFPLSATH